MRRGWIAAGVALLAGLALLLVVAATRESTLVYTIGAAPGAPIANLEPGEEVCQTPVAPPPEAFDRVVIGLQPSGPPGAPVEVLLRSRSGDVVAEGRLDGGYAKAEGPLIQAVPIGPVTVREPVELCVRNTGEDNVAALGTTGLAHRTSVATFSGKAVGDLAVVLERSEPRSLLARLPQVFDHAAAFKAGWVGPWTFWLLAALVLVAVPLLLARGLAAAARDEPT
jgi:hypothetical protein